MFVLVPSTLGILLLGVIIFILHFFLVLEATVTEFTSKPSKPTFVLEGKDITVKWSYTLNGAVGQVTFNNVTGGVRVQMGKTFSAGSISLNQARFSAEVSNTQAQLKILEVQSSDQGEYEVLISATGVGTLLDVVVVIVQCKYLQTTKTVVSIPCTFQHSVRRFLTPKHS